MTKSWFLIIFINFWKNDIFVTFSQKLQIYKKFQHHKKFSSSKKISQQQKNFIIRKKFPISEKIFTQNKKLQKLQNYDARSASQKIKQTCFGMTSRSEVPRGLYQGKAPLAPPIFWGEKGPFYWGKCVARFLTVFY